MAFVDFSFFIALIFIAGLSIFLWGLAFLLDLLSAEMSGGNYKTETDFVTLRSIMSAYSGFVFVFITLFLLIQTSQLQVDTSSYLGLPCLEIMVFLIFLCIVYNIIMLNSKNIKPLWKLNKKDHDK